MGGQKSSDVTLVFNSGCSYFEVVSAAIPKMSAEKNRTLYVPYSRENIISNHSQVHQLEDEEKNWLSYPAGPRHGLHPECFAVPIVVVFTKFDRPVTVIKRKLPKTADQDKVARDAAKEKFWKDYAEPLSKLPDRIPRVEVSSKRKSHSLVSDPLIIYLGNIGYKDTLDRLVELTEKEVKGAMSYIWASSQFPSADLKIKASIQCVHIVCLGPARF